MKEITQFFNLVSKVEWRSGCSHVQKDDAGERLQMQRMIIIWKVRVRMYDFRLRKHLLHMPVEQDEIQQESILNQGEAKGVCQNHICNAQRPPSFSYILDTTALTSNQNKG